MAFQCRVSSSCVMRDAPHSSHQMRATHVTNSRSRVTLRTLLTEAAPVVALSTIAMRQLVAYYSDWRRSRDILSDPDELSERRAMPRVSEILTSNGLRSLRLR